MECGRCGKELSPEDAFETLTGGTLDQYYYCEDCDECTRDDEFVND